MTPPASASDPVDPALAPFYQPVSDWFAGSLGRPTLAQQRGWPPIQQGRSVLLIAPTGSGKTLAAFLVALDRLLFDPPPDPNGRCRVLYVSPLKALAADVERNLKVPLAGIVAEAEKAGVPVHLPAIAVRSGDTPAAERAAFRRRPTDILITTPESLYLLLTSGARDTLRSVRTLILDEVHALVGNKRGAHLALTLERLEELTGTALQRIGLSATVRPPEEAARFLGGFGDDGKPRPVEVVDAGSRKALDLRVALPMEERREERAPAGVGPAGDRSKGLWPALHPRLLELIRAHRSTLIFVNNRRTAERLSAGLNQLAGEDLVKAHHGSVAADRRRAIEEALKAGRLPAMVATSSLELGIDMGAIDLVVLVESPPSVASGLQRVGRAGHTVGAPSRGVLFPKFKGDLLATAALTRLMREGQVEAIRYLRHPLDVLAQQVVAMTASASDPLDLEKLERIVRRAAPFATLPRAALEDVVDMLGGRYPSDAFAELRPRLVWDRKTGKLRPREGARLLAVTSGGTIPDRGLFGVFLAGAESGARVGELDEEMVFESRPGDTFVLGASTWRVEAITHDRVLVSPAPGEPGKTPFWRGEAPARPLEFGRAIGRLARELRAQSPEAALARLTAEHSLEEAAARSLLEYLAEQAAATGAVPDDHTIVIERVKDEMGDYRVCILSPFGGKVLGPWAMAIAARLAEQGQRVTGLVWTDDGIVVRFPEADRPPPAEWVLPDPERVEELVRAELGSGGSHPSGQSVLFATRFREAAARALLLPRRAPGRRSPLWLQRRRAADLLDAAAPFGSFPIVLEAYRECLQDLFDLPATVELLADVRLGRVKLVVADTAQPSPFAASILFGYVANFIYEGDAPIAERKAQALSVDVGRLRELLGEASLRELLDAGVIADFERWLQHLAPERAARSPDALHDLLVRLGDLGEEEARARVTAPEEAGRWLAGLVADGRAIAIPLGGETRFVAAEEAGRFRDAFGIAPPADLPSPFLEPAPDALADVIARWARSHGPFAAAAVARRFQIGAAPVLEVLRRLGASGRVLAGEFRPGGSGEEWCDAGVLAALRQKSLARLRHEVEPVAPEALGRFYADWQGIAADRRGPEALHEVVAQLGGAAIPASILESRVLPARIRDYAPRDLDALTAAGSVVWIGDQALGERDGRIRLYRSEDVALLHAGARGDAPAGALHARLRELLSARGALFFPQLQQALGGFPPELLAALWNLVWAGEVTNDTLEPLRVLLDPRRGRARRSSPASRLAPPPAAGRWYLVQSLIASEPAPAERMAACARQLLERHGVLTREAVQAEGLDGGFAAVYPALKAMEEAGRVRRGYFVAGRGALQFAHRAAAERLRALRDPAPDPSAVVLAAADPANPWGAALAWPETEDPGRRPMRAAGSFVVLVDGALAAWLSRGERLLLTFLDRVADRAPEEVACAVARALADEVDSGRRKTLFVERVDGLPAARSALAPALAAAGFAHTPHGYLKRP